MQASRKRADELRVQARKPGSEIDPVAEYEVAVWAVG